MMVQYYCLIDYMAVQLFSDTKTVVASLAVNFADRLHLSTTFSNFCANDSKYAAEYHDW